MQVWPLSPSRWNETMPWVATQLLRLGVLLLVLAALWAGQIAWSSRHLERASALVTENVPEFAPQGGLRYRAHLRFRSAGGQLVEITDPECFRAPRLRDGTRLPVRYPAGAPQQAVPASIWRVFGSPLLLAIFATVLFDLGYLLRLRSLRALAAAQKST